MTAAGTTGAPEIRRGPTSLLRRLHEAKAFVFDFYGTLVTDAVSVPPMWQVLADLGYPSHPELEAMFEPDAFDGTTTASVAPGNNHDEWIRDNWRQFVKLSGVPAPEVEQVLEQLLAARSAYRARAVPGARDLLTALRARGLRLGLCSNWENDISPYLSQAGLPLFDAVATSVEVGARKPHPAIFTAISARLGVEAEYSVFVGDNWSADVVGAVRAGMVPVWLRLGRPSRGIPSHVLEFDTLTDFASYLGI